MKVSTKHPQKGFTISRCTKWRKISIPSLLTRDMKDMIMFRSKLLSFLKLSTIFSIQTQSVVLVFLTVKCKRIWGGQVNRTRAENMLLLHLKPNISYTVVDQW